MEQNNPERPIESQALRVPFGLKDGRLYTPDETARGKACGCRCPGCGNVLVANQGEVKRAYFSHHQSSECASGYESAIHLMAKQVILDKCTLTLPEFKKSYEIQLPNGRSLEERFVEKASSVALLNIRLEESALGLRPDIVGDTPDGKTVYIEIFVTHRVTEDKRDRFADRNMVEINLSHLSPDALANEEGFANKVLHTAPREWVSCTIYDQQLIETQQRLQDRKAEYDQEQAEKRRKQEAETQRVENIEANRLRFRTQLQPVMDQLSEMLNGGYLEREHTLLEKDQAAVTKISLRHPEHDIPQHVSQSIPNDWIFNTHRVVWQTHIFDKYIAKKPPESQFSAVDVKRDVVRTFGLLDWMETLVNGKYHYKQQGRVRNQWYGEKGYWFLDDDENRSIPSPFLTILQYLRSLCTAHFLREREDCHFEVRNRSIEEVQEVLEEQRRNEEALLRIRIAEAEAEQALREAERKRIDTMVETRISELIQLVKSLQNVGHTKLYRCGRCSHFQPVGMTKTCFECGHNKVWITELTQDYIESLPYRLRSVTVLPDLELP